MGGHNKLEECTGDSLELNLNFDDNRQTERQTPQIDSRAASFRS